MKKLESLRPLGKEFQLATTKHEGRGI